MGLQNLTDNSAFSPGSDLWILPDPKVSHWARKIDWYLNFQFARAEHHLPPVLEPGLLSLLQEEKLAPPSISANLRAALMVSSGHRLPAIQTVEVPFDGNLGEWLTKVTSIWRDLSRPTLRLFLPRGITVTQAEALWPSPSSQTGGVSAVADSDFQSETKARS